MNIWDIVVIIVVAAVLILAFRLYAGIRKKGSGCGCGCADCSSPCANRTSEPNGSAEKKD